MKRGSFTMRAHLRLITSVSLLLVLLVLAACNSSTSAPISYGTPPPAPPVVLSHTPCAAPTAKRFTLTLYYGSEKQAWIEHVVHTFNRRNYVACDGPIT